jgi:bifunctional DNase/RNase
VRTSLLIITMLAGGGCGSASGQTVTPNPNADTSGAEAKLSKAQIDEISTPGPGMTAVTVENVLQKEDGAIIAVLKEEGGDERIIPIFIGETEGRAIAMRLSRQKYVRPLTHDLLESVIRECDIRLLKVEIDDLKDSIFLAHLFLVDPSGTLRKVDARPSDAMALALGVNAPIFMARTIIDDIGEILSTEDEPPPPEEEPSATPTGAEMPLQQI